MIFVHFNPKVNQTPQEPKQQLETLIQGVEMIHKTLEKVFEKHGVEKV